MCCSCFDVRKYHDGHVERCFMCLPVKFGTYAWGLIFWILVIQGITMAVLNELTYLAVIGSIYVSWPLITFLIMCCHNSMFNVKHFALAYKCFTYLNSTILVLFMIYLILSVTPFALPYVIQISTNPVTTGIQASHFTHELLLSTPITIMVNIHLNKVVQTYASEHIARLNGKIKEEEPQNHDDDFKRAPE